MISNTDSLICDSQTPFINLLDQKVFIIQEPVVTWYVLLFDSASIIASWGSELA